MEWRGQQHAREAVESTASGATAATIAYIIMDDRPDGEEHGTAQSGSDEDGRVHTGLVSRPKHPEKRLAFYNALQELKEATI